MEHHSKCLANDRIYSLGLSFGPMHWTQSDDDMCPKVDTCYHLNGSSTIRHLNLSLNPIVYILKQS